MRIQSIAQTQQFKPANPSGFHEGASTTAEKITALVATLLAAAASFFVLPAEAAVLMSGGIAILFTTIFCGSSDDSGNDWDLGRIFSSTVGSPHPVLQPGLRNIPGTGHNPVVHIRADLHPNPAVRRHPNVQPVLVQHSQLPVRPNVQPQPRQQQQQHVPVGNGRNQNVQRQGLGQPPVHPNVQPQLRQQQQQQQHVPVGNGRNQNVQRQRLDQPLVDPEVQPQLRRRPVSARVPVGDRP